MTEINIASEIKDILMEYGEVVIPEFGGLVSTYKAAVVDGIGGNVHPPSLHVTFDPLLQVNDGILVGHLRQKYGLSATATLDIIEVFTKDAKDRFENGEIVVLPEIGRLYRDFARKIQFLPDPTNFNADSFGLSAVQFSPVIRSKTVAPIETIVENPVEKALVNLLPIAENVAPIETIITPVSTPEIVVNAPILPSDIKENLDVNTPILTDFETSSTPRTVDVTVATPSTFVEYTPPKMLQKEENVEKKSVENTDIIDETSLEMTEQTPIERVEMAVEMGVEMPVETFKNIVEMPVIAADFIEEKMPKMREIGEKLPESIDNISSPSLIEPSKPLDFWENLEQNWRSWLPAAVAAIVILLCVAIWQLSDSKTALNTEGVKKTKPLPQHVNTSPIGNKGVTAEANVPNIPTQIPQNQQDTNDYISTDVFSKKQKDNVAALEQPQIAKAEPSHKAIILLGSFGNKANIGKLKAWINAKNYGIYERKTGNLTLIGCEVGYEKKADLEKIMNRLREKFGDDIQLYKK